jgi:hypothetical protein
MPALYLRSPDAGIMQLGTLDTLVTKGQNKMNKLLTYAETKTLFGWKSTSSIRRYVASGDLVRAQFGRGMNSFRITSESAEGFYRDSRHAPMN